MPHLLAIVLCIFLVAGLAGLVKLEYNRARKGPRMSSEDFYRLEEQHGSPETHSRSRIQHDIGY
jgi:hypothetical protein